MATNSGDDMRKMQEEAVRRVREMQSRARQHLDSENIPAPSAPHPPKAPPKKEGSAPPAKPAVPINAIGSSDVFEMLFKDHERTLLLILLILISGEKEDPALMFALLYLLI